MLRRTVIVSSKYKTLFASVYLLGSEIDSNACSYRTFRRHWSIERAWDVLSLMFNSVEDC